MRLMVQAGLVVAIALAAGACQSGSRTDSADTTSSAPSGDSARGVGASTGAPAGDSAAAVADSVVLRTDKQRYRAGEQMTLTLENKSARSYAFNPCTRSLERDDNGSWRAVEEPDRICTMEAWILDPHGTRTGTTELPSPLAAGRYRVVVRMTIESPGAPASAVVAVSDPITVG